MPRFADVPLYEGDDFQTLSDLRREADHAQRIADELQIRKAQAKAARLGDDEAVAAAEAQEVAEEKKAAYDAFVDEAAERATNVRIQSLPGRKFRDLMAEHPPAKDDSEDAEYGVNLKTFPDALLEYVDPDDSKVRTILEPKHATKGELVAFLSAQALGDLETFFELAYGLNRNPSADPKAGRYSAAPRTSAVT